MDNQTLKLSKPLSAHGVEITEITLREPTTTDVMEIGFPYLVVVGSDDSEAVEIRPKIIVRYVSKLGAVPMSTAQSMSISDLTQAQALVLGFFGQDLAT